MHLELTDQEAQLLHIALDSHIYRCRQELQQIMERDLRESLRQDLDRLEQIQRRLDVDAVVAENQIAS